MSGQRRVEELVERLEAAAERLRAGALDAEGAAALIDQCAELAAQAGSELERVAEPEDPGLAGAPAVHQESLTGPRQDPLL